MVDGGGVDAGELEIALGAEGGRRAVGNLAHALFHQVQRLAGVGAHGAAQLATVGDDVGRVAAVQHGDGDHRRVGWLLVAADDGLKGLQDLRGDRQRIHRQVRHGAVPALAAHAHQKLVAGRQHRPGRRGEVPGGNARHVVHAEDGLHRKALEQAVFHHLARAAAVLFGGLEDQVHGAFKAAGARQLLRGAQQHGGVAVVAAGVHHAGVAAGVREFVGLGHRQRVHVGAQAHGARRIAVFKNADHAGLAQAAVHRNAPLRQQVGHQIGGAGFLERQLGVGMDVAADVAERGRVGDDVFNQVHGGFLQAGRWLDLCFR